MWLDDEYWLRAAKFIVTLPSHYHYVLAPAEMNHLRMNCLPAAFAYILDPKDTVLVLPKDDIDLLPLPWIKSLRQWEVIYADEVFAALKWSGSPFHTGANHPHLPYLYSRADKVLAGQGVRKSNIDTPLSDDIAGRPYAIVAVASTTGNGGERLIAAAAIRLLRKAWPDLAVIVTDGNVDRPLVAGASAIVIGPGGMLYDFARTRLDLMNLANWFRFGHLAAEYGVPLYLLGVGHQGMHSPIGWKFVAEALATARLAATRDRDTAQMLAGRLSCPVEALPDLSVLFADDIRAMAEAAPERSERVVSLCGDYRHVAGVTECLSEVLKAAGPFALRVVIQANEDFEAWEVHREGLTRLFGASLEVFDCRESDPADFCRTIATSDVVLTTRFHGMMVSLMAGIDLLVLTTPGDKRERVREEIGQHPWVRFAPRVSDLRTLAPAICDLVIHARREPQRGIRFDTTRLYRLADMLAACNAATPPLAP